MGQPGMGQPGMGMGQPGMGQPGMGMGQPGMGYGAPQGGPSMAPGGMAPGGMGPAAAPGMGMPGMAPGAAPAAGLGGGPALHVIYQGQRHHVNKDRFIIGRGKQSSDMTIKDPNVSRQHAMVEFLNGQYYMVDMGSTNGVEYNGQRIARKAIAEGDIFRICDHEVRFSYR